MDRDDQPRWGQLIEDARERAGISQNEAARRAEITGTHWRKVVRGEAGTMDSDRGVRTLVRMARVVGLDSGAFDGVRDDVADALLAIEVPEAMERSEALNVESEEIIRRIRHRLGLMSPRQLALMEQLAAELARRESNGDDTESESVL